MSDLADIDVFVEDRDIEACQRFGKPDNKKLKVPFTNTKNCKKNIVKESLPVLIALNTTLANNFCKQEFEAHKSVNVLQLKKVQAQWGHSWLLFQRWHRQNQIPGKRYTLEYFPYG